MLVNDIMIRDVATVSSFATIRDAMRLMKQRNVKSLIVEKRDAHDAYGIITYTNILKTIVAEEGDIDLINVYDICVRPALTVSKELDVKYAARLMVNMGIRRLLVTANNELLGIVSMNDIVGTMVEIIDADLG